MSDIISKTFLLAPTTDKAITLAGEEYLSKLSIGNNWKYLRIGIMMSVAPNGTNPHVNGKLMLGLCASAPNFINTKGYASGNAEAYVGGKIGSGNNADLAYTANGGNPFYCFNGSNGSRTVIAGVETSYIGASSGNYCAVPTIDGTVKRRGWLYVDFDRSRTVDKIFMTMMGVNGPTNTAHISRDYSLVNFLDAFDNIQYQSLKIDGVSSSHSDIPLTGVNFASSLILDTVSVYWNKSQYPLEVYAIAAKQLA